MQTIETELDTPELLALLAGYFLEPTSYPGLESWKCVYVRSTENLIFPVAEPTWTFGSRTMVAAAERVYPPYSPC